MRAPWTVVREIVGNWDVSRGAFWNTTANSIRGFFNFSMMRRRPDTRATVVNWGLTRALYRNSDAKRRYGAGFVRPIIDLTADYMGLPTVSGDEEDFLNDAIQNYWASALHQMVRDSCRDSKVVVRFYQPRIDNPLFTAADRRFGCIEIVPPEMCQITYDPVDKNFILQAIFTHYIDMDDRTLEELASGVEPRMKTHEVVEVITPEGYRYFDKTNGSELTSWATSNVYNFVPAWEVWNEYSADLGGGQSDLEAVIPYIEAFHDALSQALDAHEYHSIPKVKLNVKSVDSFIANNWPEVVDPETKKIINGAKINWQGHEIFFFAEGEDGGFIEAKSVLGDSKVLLSFLIDCICIASETPRWALLADDLATDKAASVEPFKKKIDRKRKNFNEAFVMICKMALVANSKTPTVPKLIWQSVDVEDLATKGQAIQQIVLALDVATANGMMATKTAVAVLKVFFPEMDDADAEMALAKSNANFGATAAAPASKTQALPPPSPSSNGNGNGGGDKAAAVAAVKQLTTTTASRS